MAKRNYGGNTPIVDAEHVRQIQVAGQAVRQQERRRIIAALRKRKARMLAEAKRQGIGGLARIWIAAQWDTFADDLEAGTL